MAFWRQHCQYILLAGIGLLLSSCGELPSSQKQDSQDSRSQSIDVLVKADQPDPQQIALESGGRIEAYLMIPSTTFQSDVIVKVWPASFGYDNPERSLHDGWAFAITTLAGASISPTRLTMPIQLSIRVKSEQPVASLCPLIQTPDNKRYYVAANDVRLEAPFATTDVFLTQGAVGLVSCQGQPAGYVRLEGIPPQPVQLTILDGGEAIREIDVGSALVGQEKELLALLENNGDQTITNITLEDPAPPFRIVADNCGGDWEPSTSCAISLSFAPEELGVFEATLQVSYSSGETPKTTARPMRARGVSPATLSVTGELTFAETLVGESSQLTLTLHNEGQTVLTGLSAPALESPFEFAGGDFPGDGGSCGSTIAISSSCTVVVSFAPETADLFYQPLNFSYSDGTNSGGQKSLSLELEAPSL